MLDLMWFLGGVLGGASGGFLLTEFGAETVYVVAISLFLVTMAYGAFVVKETKVSKGFVTWFYLIYSCSPTFRVLGSKRYNKTQASLEIPILSPA